MRLLLKIWLHQVYNVARTKTPAKGNFFCCLQSMLCLCFPPWHCPGRFMLTVSKRFALSSRPCEWSWKKICLPCNKQHAFAQGETKKMPDMNISRRRKWSNFITKYTLCKIAAIKTMLIFKQIFLKMILLF